MVVGSNPATPTKKEKAAPLERPFLFRPSDGLVLRPRFTKWQESHFARLKGARRASVRDGASEFRPINVLLFNRDHPLERPFLFRPSDGLVLRPRLTHREVLMLRAQEAQEQPQICRKANLHACKAPAGRAPRKERVTNLGKPFCTYV